MGLFADALKKAKSENEGKFKPPELCEMNIQAIFNRCLAMKDDDREELSRSVLFQRDLGYDDVQWTDDTVTLMMLYHLGETTKGILPFVKRSNTATIGLSITPTLSPKDPAFSAWWEAHKAEWEA